MAPIYIMCEFCNDIINSTYSGLYTSCSCQAIAIDQTEDYCRVIGDSYLSPFDVLQNYFELQELSND